MKDRGSEFEIVATDGHRLALIIAKHQIQETIVQGTAAALFEAMRFENGGITNPRLSQYRVTRLPDVLDIEVVVLDRKGLPSPGAGETPIVAGSLRRARAWSGTASPVSNRTPSSSSIPRPNRFKAGRFLQAAESFAIW